MASNTPNMGLARPDHKAARWDLPLNANFDLIDNFYKKSEDADAALTLSVAPAVKLAADMSVDANHVISAPNADKANIVNPKDLVTKEVLDNQTGANGAVYASARTFTRVIPNDLMADTDFVIYDYGGTSNSSGLTFDPHAGTIIILKDAPFRISLLAGFYYAATTVEGFLWIKPMKGGTQQIGRMGNRINKGSKGVVATFDQVHELKDGDTISFHLVNQGVQLNSIRLMSFTLMFSELR